MDLASYNLGSNRARYFKIGLALRGRPILKSETLRKTRRHLQRERHKTEGLMNRTMAVHLRYKSWYISLPFFAKQQRKMTSLRTRPTKVNFSYFYLELNAFRGILTSGKF